MSVDKYYYLNNYGLCKLEKCLCVDPINPRFNGAWGGLACPDWLPLGLTNPGELLDIAKKHYLSSKQSGQTNDR